MKIGVITLFRRNYGSMLQAFSTKRFIESMGFQCDIFNVQLSRRVYAKIWRRIFPIIWSLFCPLFRKHFLLQKKVYEIDDQNPVFDSVKMMNSFVDNDLSPQKITANELNTLSFINQYGYFISGSDQIWKCILSFNPINFLQFVPQHKRIAFAASFGISEIPSYNQRKLRKALNGFDYISVREETGVEIVKRYSNAKVCRIADPTFIYNANEWRNFAKDANVSQKKYIFVHFLNKPNQPALESIKWLSEKLNLSVVAVGYNYDVLKSLNRFVYMDGGPWEYVSYIDNAEYVITDSFHSMLFSINFNKRFFIFHRQYSVSKQTSRITDLLKRFGMVNRLIENVDDVKKMYQENQSGFTREILEKERADVRDYLQKSISGQIPQSFLQGEIYG